MVQRLFNIDKWTTLVEGEAYLLPTDEEGKLRRVRLEVNAPDPVRLFLIEPDQESVRFLARVDGRDCVEFVASGTLRLVVEGGPIGIYTVDGDDISFEVAAPVIFTKIMERRRRNPDLEYIAAKMNANMERRLAQQADDLRRLLANRETARAALEAASGVHVGARTEPTQDGDSGASDPPPFSVDGGSDDRLEGG